VVRAVGASVAPVVSGVGHETDFTLTDFAADLRAPTPTAAAEVATPDRTELLGMLADLANRHTTQFNALLADLRYEHGRAHHALDRTSPKHAINAYRQRLDEIIFRLDRSMQVKLEKKALQLANLQQSLRGLSPQAVLNRGYAIVTHEKDGTLVKSADQVQAGEGVHIQVSRGELDARITKTTQEEQHVR
jgi:exodeoxyribonuclease VII large subunit